MFFHLCSTKCNFRDNEGQDIFKSFTQCLCLCLSKADICKNEEPQTSEEYANSPVCSHIELQLIFSEKEEPHNSQGYGLSLACVRICVTKLELHEKGKPYALQECDSLLHVFVNVL